MKLLAIAYPEFAEADLKLIEDYRKINDTFFPIVKPHFTIVFPISDIPIAEFTNEIKFHLKQVNRILFCLRCSVLNKDAFSDLHHTFLVPDEGFSRIIKLHDKLYSGSLSKYQRLDIDFIPHIGIGNSPDMLKCKKMVDEWNSNDFAINGIISSINIVKYENDKVNTTEKIILNV